MTPIIYHIPVCPFSQRIEIQLALKQLRDAVEFRVVDITKPRPDWLLKLSKGTTALPIMDVGNLHALKESMVIMRYIESAFPNPPVARTDHYEHALESILVGLEGEFSTTGYLFVLNQDQDACAQHYERMLDQWRKLNAFLNQYAPGETFVFDEFGWAESVFTPFFMRFWFLDYYENFELPDTEEFDRVKRWRDACLEHPAAQQVSYDQIVKLYYDYAKGAGNGSLLPERKKSSFVFEPDWSQRPLPPRDKYLISASDEQLGLA